MHHTKFQLSINSIAFRSEYRQMERDNKEVANTEHRYQRIRKLNIRAETHHTNNVL